MTILVGIDMLLPSTPPVFKTTFPAALIPVMAAMASRVFRNTKLFDRNDTLMESLPVV